MQKVEHEKQIKQLNKFYDELTEEIENELENLEYLIKTVEVENINLIEIHYKIKSLIIKKDEIKNELLNYNIIRND